MRLVAFMEAGRAIHFPRKTAGGTASPVSHGRALRLRTDLARICAGPLDLVVVHKTAPGQERSVSHREYLEILDLLLRAKCRGGGASC